MLSHSARCVELKGRGGRVIRGEGGKVFGVVRVCFYLYTLSLTFCGLFALLNLAVGRIDTKLRVCGTVLVLFWLSYTLNGFT